MESVQVLADTFERTPTSIKCRLESLRKRLFGNLPQTDDDDDDDSSIKRKKLKKRRNSRKRKSIYDQQIHVIKKKDKLRRVQSENNKDDDKSDEQVPDHFCDPITFEAMIKPTLVIVSGVTYERSVIEE